MDDSIRHQLVTFMKRGARTSAFTLDRPTDWRPGDGHAVETILLDRPPGRKAYVMTIDLNPGRPLLYVKLELGSGVVIGRSFHESERK